MREESQIVRHFGRCRGRVGAFGPASATVDCQCPPVISSPPATPDPPATASPPVTLSLSVHRSNFPRSNSSRTPRRSTGHTRPTNRVGSSLVKRGPAVNPAYSLSVRMLILPNSVCFFLLYRGHKLCRSTISGRS